MTGPGRTLWFVAAVAAAAGLLLSLAFLVPSPAAEPPREVRGGASVLSEGAPPVTAVPGELFRRDGVAPRVRRSSAALEEQPRAGRGLEPRRVRIPALDLALEVRPTGVERGRQMRLPDDPRVLGWYRYGPAPTRPGSAVLAGHVDTEDFGVGPLAALAGVRPGARVEVTTRSGRRQVFRVDSVEAIDRQRLPDEVFSREGRSRLRIVTCTGAFVPEAGGYQQNLVVTALPVR